MSPQEREARIEAAVTALMIDSGLPTFGPHRATVEWRQRIAFDAADQSKTVAVGDDDHQGNWVTVAEYLGPPPPGYPADGTAEVHCGITSVLYGYTRAHALADARRTLARFTDPPFKAQRIVVVDLAHATIEQAERPTSTNGGVHKGTTDS